MRHPLLLCDLLHHFNLTGQPLSFVPRFRRAVESQEAEPALAGNGLEPVRFLAGRCLWAEVEIERPVVVVDHRVFVTQVVLAGVRLAGLELEQSCEGARSSLTLNLEGVLWIDDRAAETLRQLMNGGTVVTSGSPYVALRLKSKGEEA